MDYSTLPAGPLLLQNLTIPACLMDRPGDLVRADLSIVDGKIASSGGVGVEMNGAMVFPAFVDMHTHLDKGHIWDRAPNPDGTFDGALATVRADHGNWSIADLRQRIQFSLRCAFAHGTKAIRTHLDSMNGLYLRSWPVFAEMRLEWAGRIDLQAVCLIGCDGYSDDGEFLQIADTVAEFDGILGMVTYPMPDLKDRLSGFFAMAAERGLDMDFHVDETMDPGVETLRAIAETVLETGFEASVTVGHCCSLSAQDEDRAMETLDLVAEAGINVVSLPMCNLYLQDRRGGRTPRSRGITLVHEMKARGIEVSFASDNTRDPFYAYGDMDMIEVMREATRIGHLDHSDADWVQAFLGNPARAAGFDLPSLAPGTPADLVVCKARSWTELFARPQSDRIVLRGGVQIDRTLPDYAELDPLMEIS